MAHFYSKCISVNISYWSLELFITTVSIDLQKCVSISTYSALLRAQMQCTQSL